MSKKAAKTGDRKKQAAPKVELGPFACADCGKVKSMSKTRALFAVIEEDRVVCHHCAPGMDEVHYKLTI